MNFPNLLFFKFFQFIYAKIKKHISYYSLKSKTLFLSFCLRGRFRMSNRVIELFEDENIKNRIKEKLPYLFRLAESNKENIG